MPIVHKEETGLCIPSPFFACVTNDVGLEGGRHYVTIFTQVGMICTIQEMNGGLLPAYTHTHIYTDVVVFPEPSSLVNSAERLRTSAM